MADTATTTTTEDTGYSVGLDVDESPYQDIMQCPLLMDNAVDDAATQGEASLFDFKEAKTTWVANQVPTLQMTYPRNGKFIKLIQVEKILVGDVNRIITHQKFRINEVLRSDQDIVVNATHIIGEYLVNNPIKGSQPITGANVTASWCIGEILGHLAKPVPEINYDSDVTKVANANIDISNTNALNALLDPDQIGDKPANSVLAQYGGDFYFDNTTIYHREHAGRDRNITVRYGQNITSYSQQKTINDMYVGIYAYADYNPGPALATLDNVDWNGLANQSDWGSVASVTYNAAGSVDIYSAPVKGAQVIGQLTTGTQIQIGKPIHDGDTVASSIKAGVQLQVNTMNGDDWYPLASGGWIDGQFVNFDKTGDYVVNNVVGHIHTAISSSGALIRYPTHGTGTVSYTDGYKNIHVYYSPDQGPQHYRIKDKNGKEKTIHNGTKLKYDYMTTDENGHTWYRIGPHQWVYGDHFSTGKNGDVQSFSSRGYGLVKSGAKKYALNHKTGTMEVQYHHLSLTAARKQHKKKYIYKGKGKKKKAVKNPNYQRGKAITQKHKYYNLNYGQVRVGGVLYYKLSNGSYVRASDIDKKASKTHIPDSPTKIMNQITQERGKIEMYSTPSKGSAANWSIPANVEFDISKSAQGADGKTWYQVTYKGVTGWIPAEYTSSSGSNDLEPQAPDSSANSYDESSDNAIAVAEDQTVHVELTDDLDNVVNGVIYPAGMNYSPENAHIMKLDLSNCVKHDDQDLSGLQDDGTYKPTKDDIQQLYQAAVGSLKEYKIGEIPLSMTVSYADLDGEKADLLALNMYDIVNVDFTQWDKIEKGKITGTVWVMAGKDSHYESVTIGDPPKSYEHLLLERAEENTASQVSRASGHTQGLLSRYKNMLAQEGSNRIAAERKLMDDLGLVQHQVDQNGRDIKTSLVSMKTFENQMNEIQNFADDITNWVKNPGSGVIQANPNWQKPVSLSARTGSGGHMWFSGNGLIFTDPDGITLRGGLDSEGRMYADAIKAGTIEAVNIKSCLVESALQIGTEGGSMNIYIGTRNPRSILNPLNGGNVIWAMSDSYQSMMSSGQIALTNGNLYTRLHPSEVTVGEDKNQVLTQRNFAGHAYYRIKSWVRAWIADWITIRGTKYWIWKGSDKGVNRGKLRNLKGQGQTDYSYSPGSDDDYGSEETGSLDGIDLGSLTFEADLQEMNQQWQNTFNNFQDSYQITVPTPSINLGGGVTINPSDLDRTSSKAGMLNYTQAYHLGLGPKNGHYTEAVGTMKGGNDGHMYVLKLYTPTGNKHWYRVQ